MRYYFQVKESMENLENVVKERNRAYWLLETGEDGERPGAIETDNLGRFCSSILCMVSLILE